MHLDILVAEIGSTTTVVNGFTDIHTENPRYLGQGWHHTTVEEGDVLEGLQGAVKDLARHLEADQVQYDDMLACSSAAGGLRMTVHGLVYDMTVKAANEAALGAGAVVRQVTAGDLTESDLENIAEIDPNIILLAGGVDYGERDTAISNAEKLDDLEVDAPVIFAGNVACRDEIRDIFGPDRVRVVDNVYPRIDQLNIKPTRTAIQEVFEEHIIRAPGMSRVRDMVSGEISPTPGAVMEASDLLYEYIGDLVTLDVGGATTDVHSVTEGSEEVSRMLIAPEPVAKRTVEGDLGVYKNAENLLLRLGEEEISEELGFNVRQVLDQMPPLPQTREDKQLVIRLTSEAVTAAFARHAGQTRHLYGPSGRQTVAEGKDLTRVKWVIGTGGALTQLGVGEELLEDGVSQHSPMSLYPDDPRYLIDSDYIMAALGVLSRRYPEAAARLLTDSLGVDLKE